MKEMNVEMADILEVDSVEDDMLLEEYDAWDSLAILSILAFIDSEYGVNLSSEDIKDIKNLGDLKLIVQSKS